METNNREFSKLKNILFISLGIICIVFMFVKNIYILFFICFIVTIGMYQYCHLLIKKIFQRIRNLILYIDQGSEYIKDDDLGIIYDKVQQLKKSNEEYKKNVIEEKKLLKKDIVDICHQMKTPLASLSLYNELLEKNCGNKYIEESTKQINKMNSFINGLLKLSKLETVNFQYDKLTINYIVNMSLHSLHFLIISHNTIIHHHEEEIQFYCDEGWLQEALNNIFKNAIERNCENLTITYKKNSRYFKLYIHNDGQEISNKDLPKIFNRFYRSSNSINSGVGIGLSLAKEIILKHHGYINVYNKKGVVFEITLPIYVISNKYDVTKL